jgi:2-dehydro-3-deoxygluconokinase
MTCSAKGSGDISDGLPVPGGGDEPGGTASPGVAREPGAADKPGGAAEAESPLVVGFGEALIRLTAKDHSPLEFASELTVEVGGAELNTLVAMAQLGCRARWVSRLPRNALGQRIAGHARRHSVDLAVEWDSDARAGLFFVEEGAHPRPTQVLYDRAGSSASRMQPGMFDWPRILDSAAALHCSGITCALGSDAERAVLEALESAAAAGAMTSFDINYRSQLWDRAAAGAAFRRVLPKVNILFASPFDLALITGGDVGSRQADEVREEFGLDLVVVRTQSAAGPGAVRVNVEVFGGKEPASGTAQATVLDAFGAGDIAVAAFLARLLAHAPLEEAASAAAKGSAHMYTLPGDTWLRPSVEFEADGALAGRIHR